MSSVSCAISHYNRNIVRVVHWLDGRLCLLLPRHGQRCQFWSHNNHVAHGGVACRGARQDCVALSGRFFLTHTNFISQGEDSETSVEYTVFLTFLAGVMQLVLGVFHLGRRVHVHASYTRRSFSGLHTGIFIDFISEPVISAFTSAAAMIVAAGQVKVRRSMSSVFSFFINMNSSLMR